MADRALLQQALDALQSAYGWQATTPQLNAAITALREALAAPEPEPVAWCELTPNGSIAYFDGKPMIMCGPVGNECHTVPLYAAPPAAPAPVVPSFDRTTALILLQAASKSGDPGAIGLAAQLAGAAPCKDCGYVNFKCRCQSAAPVVRESLPLSQLVDAYCNTLGIHQFSQAFVAGARYAEQHHGIGGGGK